MKGDLTMSFYFERMPGVELEVQNFKATVREVVPAGMPVGEPQLVMRTDQAWELSVHWDVIGVAANIIFGTWRVECYLESIGPGGEFEIPELDVPMGAHPYDVTLPVPPGFVVPQMAAGEPSTPFRLTTTLTARDPAGNIWPMAGYEEGPVVQFYFPQP
jgi:hypothetical protein